MLVCFLFGAKLLLEGGHAENSADGNRHLWYKCRNHSRGRTPKSPGLKLSTSRVIQRAQNLETCGIQYLPDAMADSDQKDSFMYRMWQAFAPDQRQEEVPSGCRPFPVQGNR